MRFSVGERFVPAIGDGTQILASEHIYSAFGLTAIDSEKGRLAIPADIRSVVDQSSGGRYLCLAKHDEYPCLIGYGRSHRHELMQEIEREQDRMTALQQPFDRNRAIREKFSVVQEVIFDASGRFVLPPIIKKMGQLQDKAFFHGFGPKFCIWNPDLLLKQDDSFATEKFVVSELLEEWADKK